MLPLIDDYYYPRFCHWLDFYVENGCFSIFVLVSAAACCCTNQARFYRTYITRQLEINLFSGMLVVWQHGLNKYQRIAHSKLASHLFLPKGKCSVLLFLPRPNEINYMG